jgi:hypothetical protein
VNLEDAVDHRSARPLNEMWLNLVEQGVWGAQVAGSNPVISTCIIQLEQLFVDFVQILILTGTTGLQIISDGLKAKLGSILTSGAEYIG